MNDTTRLTPRQDTHQQPLTPYDLGATLEPKPWATPSLEHRDDFGKVDFDNEAGETVLTTQIIKRGSHYILIVDNHQDVTLTLDTVADRASRNTAQRLLDTKLEELARAAGEDVEYCNEGDPDAFALGHLSLSLPDTPTQRHREFAVTLNYPGAEPQDDFNPDLFAPTSWSCTARCYDTSQGKAEWVFLHESEGTMDEIDNAVTAAQQWLNQTELAPSAVYTPLAPSHAQVPPAPGITY